MITTFNLTLRAATLILIIARAIYWFATSRQAQRAKPKQRRRTPDTIIIWASSLLVEILLITQLLGLNFLPFPAPASLQFLGFIAIIVGFTVCISARRTLGANWAHAAEYQIKPGHELVTTGVYRFIRHPIYAGLALAALGTELLVGSLLVIPLALVLVIFAQFQAAREETLLTQQFGQAYHHYTRHTHRYIPGIW
jgi:protein-S-isoprenylcysteine O-methyltransferase Ste14